MMTKNIKRYIQIYTGDGKGKTTAALGLSIRAAGHGLKTYNRDQGSGLWVLV